MNIGPFTISVGQARNTETFATSTQHEPSEIVKAVEEFNWVRNTLQTNLRCATPSVDPYLLAALFDCNGYHSNAIYLKQAVTTGQGYEAEGDLKAFLEAPNDDESFQDILDKTSLDLETYGSLFIEIQRDEFGGISLYHSSSLNTRVKLPTDQENDESFVQFAYDRTKEYHDLSAREFPKFRIDDREGMRQLKLSAPNGNRWYGKPEYLSAKKLLTLNFSIVTLAEKWFDNAMMLDKLLVVKGTKLTDGQKRSLTNFMKRSLKGLENASRSLLLELQRGSELNVQEMQTSPKEASFASLRMENRDEIASAHRCPPRWLGIIPSGQLGSTGELEGQGILFKTGFATPRQRKIEAFWRRVFRECGFKDWQSFSLKAMDVSAGITSMQELQIGTGGQPFLSAEEAHEEWLTEKSSFMSATDAVKFLRMMNRLDAVRSRL